MTQYKYEFKSVLTAYYSARLLRYGTEVHTWHNGWYSNRAANDARYSRHINTLAHATYIKTGVITLPNFASSRYKVVRPDEQ